MRIDADRIVVRYQDADSPALSDVSISASGGTLHSVLGPNGSGKSTLMKALLGVTPLDSGETSIDGKPTVEWRRSDLARAVGAVAQTESIAFPLTVAELVAMGRYPHAKPFSAETDADRIAIRNALEACDLTDLAHRDATTLSGGEFQRARIARALAQEPGALILDEPTASLDIRHQMAILELLRSSADSGMTVLLVTHSLDLAAQFSDRMLLLSKGRVAAEGPPGDVLREDILSEVYGWPISVNRDALTGDPRVTPLRQGSAEPR